MSDASVGKVRAILGRVFGALILLLAVLVVGWQVSRARTWQFFGEIVPRVVTNRPVVALTFDDGPVPAATREILGVLRETGVRATFFLIGAELERNPLAGRQLAEAGHELGNHSWSHQRMVLKSPAFIAHEIEQTDRLIRATGYDGPIHFRPPFGKKLLILPWYLARTGRRTITWDIEPDSTPAVAADSTQIVAAVVREVRPGSIILLHVMYPGRVESLRSVRGIIEQLQQRGYGFLTVSELIDQNQRRGSGASAAP